MKTANLISVRDIDVARESKHLQHDPPPPPTPSTRYLILNILKFLDEIIFNRYFFKVS